MDEIQAAVLRVKLPMLDEMNLNRRMIAQTYAIFFNELAAELRCMNQINGSVFQHYVIRSPHRDSLRDFLLENGVGTTVHYPAPDYLLSAQNQDPQQGFFLAETENACAEVLSLPCYPELSTPEVERICELIKEKIASLN
jgi:dTDP-4-amino-4,6-dideoxygalactose transaminase